MLSGNLHKLNQLSRKERWLCGQALVLLPLVHLGLLLFGYARLQALLEKLAPLRPSPITVSDAEWLERARSRARILSIAAQHGPYKASCLRRSLLLWAWLRREGLQSQVCFGVRLCQGSLEAHAWVEYKGMIGNDAPNVRARFTPLYDAFPPTYSGL